MATISGKIHLIEPTKTFGDKGFKKRLVVLEQEHDKWTNHIPVDFTRDDCDSVDELVVGDEITVEYRLSGRKYQKDVASEARYFVSVEAKSFEVKATRPAKPPKEVASIYQDDDAPF